jgi:hypothetical protein
MSSVETTKETITYLNGYLDAIASLNSFVNDGKTYYIKLLDKVNNHIQDTVRQHLNVKTWIINYEVIEEDWKIILKKELHSYFGQIFSNSYLYITEGLNKNIQSQIQERINKVVISHNDTIDNLLLFFIHKIESLITTESIFKKVMVDWDNKEGYYENYVNDYAFDMGDQLLFLHFGSVD